MNICLTNFTWFLGTLLFSELPQSGTELCVPLIRIFYVSTFWRYKVNTLSEVNSSFEVPSKSSLKVSCQITNLCFNSQIFKFISKNALTNKHIQKLEKKKIPLVSVLKWNPSQGCESKGIINISNFEKSKKASKTNLIFTYFGYSRMKRMYKPGIDKTYGFKRHIWTFMQIEEIRT